MSSVGEELPKAIERSMDLLTGYQEIGPVGTFAATMIRQDIAEARAAIAEGDCIQMIRCLEKLKGHK